MTQSNFTYKEMPLLAFLAKKEFLSSAYLNSKGLILTKQGKIFLPRPATAKETIFDHIAKKDHPLLKSQISSCCHQQLNFSGTLQLQNKKCDYFLLPPDKGAKPFQAFASIYLIEDLAQTQAEAQAESHRQTKDNEKLLTVGHIAAGVAHDLNNIFTGILSMIHLLKWQTQDSSLLKIEQSIEDGVERAVGITQNITHYLQDRDFESPFINPGNALLGAVELLKSCLGSKITFIAEIESQNQWIEMNHAEIIQLALNLVLNAKDAMDGSGTIILKGGCLQEGNECGFFFLSVQDFGKGIADKEKIFQPFYSTKNSIGLGLSIIQSIVSKRKGSLQIFNQKGTTFYLTFPLKQLQAVL